MKFNFVKRKYQEAVLKRFDVLQENFVMYYTKTVENIEKNNSIIAQNFNKSIYEIIERLIKIEMKQKEFNVSLDEINEKLYEEDVSLLDSLLTLASCVEDFYRYAADCGNDALIAQAGMMWDIVRGELSSNEISVIDDVQKKFDFTRAATEAITSEESLPDGYVAKTLKCGYIRRGEILRKASVIVNKIKSAEEGVPV